MATCEFTAVATCEFTAVATAFGQSTAASTSHAHALSSPSTWPPVNSQHALSSPSTASRHGTATSASHASCRVARLYFIHLPACLLTYVRTHVLKYLLACLLTYVLTYLRTHALTYSRTHVLTYSRTYLLTSSRRPTPGFLPATPDFLTSTSYRQTRGCGDMHALWGWRLARTSRPSRQPPHTAYM